MPASNVYGTLVSVAGKGVLIEGPSGSGKSTLALKLLITGTALGLPVKLVSDDQVFLSVQDGRLAGTAPEAIAGLIEVWGVGPTAVDHVASSPVDLLVRLVPRGCAPRMNDDRREERFGIGLPLLELEERNADGAVLAILAVLKRGPFREH